MKIVCVALFFIFYSFNVYSEKIATFKFSYILNNINSYNNFLNELDIIKKKRFDILKNEESILVEKKRKIEDSKILITETEYLKNINEFENERNKFEKKVNEFNTFLNENIKNNEKIIFIEISNIVKQIAVENSIDLVLSDEQYYLVSDKIDISEQIIMYINEKDLKLIIQDYRD